MADFSVQDMQRVLEKAQAPNGNASAMQQFLPQLQSAVTGAVGTQESPAVAQGKAKYMDQIHQIAAMDQKLAGVYGNPSSPLYIEKGSTRQNLISGAANTGYRAAGNIKSTVQKQRASDLKDTNAKIAQVVDYYKKLTALQDKEEKLNDKQSKKNLTSIKKQKTEAAKAIGLSTTDADQISQAGITDHEAINKFLSAPAAFRKLWIRNMAVGGVPEGGFTVDDIQKNLDAYNASQAKEAAATAALKKKAKTGTSNKVFGTSTAPAEKLF